MNKLEQQILESASAGGSPSSMGAQILEKGVGKLSSTNDTTEQKPETTNSSQVPEEITAAMRDLLSPLAREQIKKEISRGGQGNKGDPVKIRESINEARGEKVRKEKDDLIVDLADLRVREKQVENLSEETRNSIAESLRHIQKRILEINLEHPELVDPLAEQEKIQRIIAEWNEGKRTSSEPNKTPEVSREEIKELPQINEEEKLQRSLERGEGYVREGAEAEKAVEALMQKNEGQEASLVTSEEIAPIIPEATVLAHTEQEPLQSAYSTAMDRIWEENEAKRKALGIENLGEGLALEPLASEPATPEKILPAPAGEVGPHLASRGEKIDGPFPVIEGEFTRVLGEKTVEQLKQEKLEKIRAKLDIMTGVVKVRAEKAGALDHIRKVGEAWNKVPKRYKYMVATGMFVAGGGAVALGYVAASRILGSMGLFATFDALLQGRYEKKTGGVRSDEAAKRHAIFAGIGALVVVGILGKVGSEVADFFKGEAVSAGSPETMAQHSTPKIEFVVEKGDTLWSGIESKLDTQGLFAGMQEGQRTYMLDALKDKFATMSPDELKAIGFTSGNIDVIHPGDHIDLTKVLGDTELMPDVIHQAEILPLEQAGSIDHPTGERAAATNDGFLVHAVPEAAPMMPQEIIPNTVNPEILTAADDITHNYVNEYFGTKGFLGFGAQDGMDSIHWKDPEVGFANQSVEKVLAAHPSAFPADSTRHFGIEDYSSTQKMQMGLTQVQQETGISTKPGENVMDYLKRAAITTLSGKSAT